MANIKVYKTMSVPEALDLAAKALQVAYSPSHGDNGTINKAVAEKMSVAFAVISRIRGDIARQVGAEG